LTTNRQQPEALSVDDIAESAGISNVALYKHFNSKDEPFAYWLRHITERHCEQLPAAPTRYVAAAEQLSAEVPTSLSRTRITSQTRTIPRHSIRLAVGLWEYTSVLERA